MTTMQQTFAGFGDAKAEAGLTPGTYLAHLQGNWEIIPTKIPAQGNRPEQDADAIKLHYLVFQQTRAGGWRTYRTSELCAPTFNVGSKLVSRLNAVNRTTVREGDDLGNLERSGWVMVELVPSRKDPKYLDIKTVVAAPQGMAMPPESILIPQSVTHGDGKRATVLLPIPSGTDGDGVPF